MKLVFWLISGRRRNFRETKVPDRTHERLNRTFSKRFLLHNQIINVDILTRSGRIVVIVLGNRLVQFGQLFLLRVDALVGDEDVCGVNKRLAH